MPSGEMVPLSQVMSKQQYDTLMFMMSRPRWDARPTPQKPSSGDFLQKVSKAEQRDDQKAYLQYQRSQREQVFTGNAGQPVGGRMQRQYKIESERNNEWTDKEEQAFQAAFGRSSYREPAARSRPTGH